MVKPFCQLLSLHSSKLILITGCRKGINISSHEQCWYQVVSLCYFFVILCPYLFCTTFFPTNQTAKYTLQPIENFPHWRAHTASHTSSNWGEMLTNSTSYSNAFTEISKVDQTAMTGHLCPLHLLRGGWHWFLPACRKKNIAQLLLLKAQFQIFGCTCQNNLELCDKRVSFHSSKATIYIYKRVWMSRDNISLQEQFFFPWRSVVGLQNKNPPITKEFFILTMWD